MIVFVDVGVGIPGGVIVLDADIVTSLVSVSVRLRDGREREDETVMERLVERDSEALDRDVVLVKDSDGVRVSVATRRIMGSLDISDGDAVHESVLSTLCVVVIVPVLASVADVVASPLGDGVFEHEIVTSLVSDASVKDSVEVLVAVLASVMV
jgi:hypothetical protein